MTVLFLNLGGGEFFVIILIAVLMFGGKGIPTIAKTLGKGMREFRDAANGIQREIERSAYEMPDEIEEKEQKLDEMDGDNKKNV
jgi:sec-independent protein translocase protein TatA